MNPYIIILLNCKCIIQHAVNENGGQIMVVQGFISRPVLVTYWLLALVAMIGAN